MPDATLPPPSLEESALPPAPAPPPPPPSPPPPPTTPQIVPSKKFPFKILLIVPLLLVLVGAGFLAVKLFGTFTGLNSTNLTWWGLWESESIIQPLIDEYQKKHPNVKITYVQQSPREYRERLQTALSQGKGPDIFRLHNSWIPMFRAELSPIPVSVFSSPSFESTFYPTARTDLKVGANYVAIPLMYDGLAMFINDDLFKSANQPPPKTWDDLRTVAQALSQCDTTDGTCASGAKILVSGAALGTADNVDHWQDILATLMLQNNVNLNAPAGKSADDALSFYTIFVREDHMWNSTLPSSTFQFAAGKVGIYFAPSWRVFDILAQNPQLKFSIHPLPQLPVDPARGEHPTAWATYWAEGVNKKSLRAAAAWEFLKFMSTPESLQKLYQNAVSSGRAFGEIYPRTDMADSLTDSPYVTAFVQQAPIARSWYLTSGTWDGSSGLNSRLSAYFADAVNSVLQSGSAGNAVDTLSAGITQVLSTYGLVAVPQVNK
ncbi:extracellular solute-binding protein [Candidatus Amesbacteria bacterium]|nr:extracellular solute-binding protein [Candidatus Amesbacteria bacterium]